MKKITAWLGTILISSAGCIGFIAPVQAAGGTASVGTASACTPTPSDFVSLAAIQANPNLTQGQELAQEVALRRQLLSKTIACAIRDAQSLKAALGAITPSAGGAAIQAQLSGKIDDAVVFYNIESGKLDGAGIGASEIIAREMLAWRTANYAPLEGDVNNFVIWSENQALFETAQNRLTQTARIVAFIENAGGDGGDLAIKLKAAQTAFQDAQASNTAAGTAIAQLQAPDQTLALIQQSLQSLADTYQKFGDLNASIQILLPTK